jgi:death-on-curing protein
MHADLIERYGGHPGIRDMGLLESALAAPAATFGGHFLHGTPAEMARPILHGLVRNHPFVDGSKRVA